MAGTSRRGQVKRKAEQRDGCRIPASASSADGSEARQALKLTLIGQTPITPAATLASAIQTGIHPGFLLRLHASLTEMHQLLEAALCVLSLGRAPPRSDRTLAQFLLPSASPLTAWDAVLGPLWLDGDGQNRRMAWGPGACPRSAGADSMRGDLSGIWIASVEGL